MIPRLGQALYSFRCIGSHGQILRHRSAPQNGYSYFPMLIMKSQRIPFGFHRSLRVTFGQSKQQKEAIRPLGRLAGVCHRQPRSCNYLLTNGRSRRRTPAERLAGECLGISIFSLTPKDALASTHLPLPSKDGSASRYISAFAFAIICTGLSLWVYVQRALIERYQ